MRGATQYATEQAIANKRDAWNPSEQAIARAQGAVSRIGTTSKFRHLGSSGQMLLSRAQLALIESRMLHRQEEYASAEERAEWAVGVADRLNDEERASPTDIFRSRDEALDRDRRKTRTCTRA